MIVRYKNKKNKVTLLTNVVKLSLNLNESVVCTLSSNTEVIIDHDKFINCK